MGESVYFSLSDFVIIIFLISFIHSFRLIKNNKIPRYMNGFYWYPAVAVIIGVLHLLQRYYTLIPKELYRITNLISLLIHFTFLSLFILQFISLKFFRKYYKLIFFLFLISLIVFIINDIINHSFISFAIANSGLLIFCIYYYEQLFRDSPTLNLLKEPSFWIITGIFFGMSTTIPIFFLAGYLYKNLPNNIFYSIATIAPFGYGMMHLFFIKAFLCKVQIHRE